MSRVFRVVLADSVAHWSIVIHHLAYDTSIFVCPVEGTSKGFPINAVIDILSPFIFVANIFSVWRFSAGPSQFTLELVGDGAMGEVQLTPTCGINGGLGKIVMPVHVDVGTSQVISIHIQLLQERQFFIFLFFIRMTFNKRAAETCASDQ